MSNKSITAKSIFNDNGIEELIMDADLLPFIERAKNGCIEAQVKLSDAFTFGFNAKRNSRLAQRFDEMIFDQTDNIHLKTNVLLFCGVRAYEAGKIEEMKDWFNHAIDHMQENIPMEEWNFSDLALIEDYIKFKLAK